LRPCLLVEIGGEDAVSILTDAVDRLDAATDAVVALDASDRSRLWAYRDSLSDAVARVGLPDKYDVCLPLAQLVPAWRAMQHRIVQAQPGARVIGWAHVGDGNLHANVVGWKAPRRKLDSLVFEVVSAAGGCIAAEHGVGRAKVEWLMASRSPAELESFRVLKEALDPLYLLNPGVLLRDARRGRTAELLARLDAHRGRGA
jgi:FAD/FMN-containing dehydrogenase